MKKIIWEKYENLVERQIDLSKEYKDKIFPKAEEDDDSYKDNKIVVPGSENDDMSMFIPNNILSEIKLITLFDAWICHTNFTISSKIIAQISKVPGVELLKPLTRYRFILSIGKAFDITEFRPKLNEVLGIENNENKQG
jgi:hypothetical protein